MDQQLIVFVEVVERKNFSRAAEALHMSQPAVSQYISSLEKEFGLRLLERNNKFVQRNKAGEIVYQYAKDILRSYNQMTVHVSDLKNEPSGELKIGASYTIGEYLLPRILAALQKEYPRIIPAVTIGNTEDIGQKLVNHEIDIGLIEGDFSHKQLVVDPFAIDEMYIIAGNHQKLKDQETVSVPDLEKETWIIRETGSGTRKMLEEFFQNNAVNPERILTFGSTQVIKEGVTSGLGISLLSELTLQKELELGLIHKLNVKGTPIKRNFSIIKNQQEFHSKALQVFEQIVKTVL
ncbi:DNA-binding transcriptional LysR family regulator [Virgibacillus natechei]|uniref:DNA-binding transcriptional LysR family regulator n=1 Tax=Virgibacillus natechei TaxID=1216297 RepID=A0ABS4IJQ8_9BACI|nr:LysR family transcriptional regulator [Virgibacillus natechei]MBP1971200.1 DNA-binding transcriptional LysR family regulator [Virgibacillus natechei]UZD11947.1 LysR family transcriptional regulator [Virgibacillus natechei]